MISTGAFEPASTRRAHAARTGRYRRTGGCHLLTALAALALAGCSGETRERSGLGLGDRPPARGTVEVPRPHLDGVESFFSRRLGEIHDEAERLRSTPGTPAAVLAETFGDLGKHYAAFGFLEAADAALRNAETSAPADSRWPHFRGLAAFDRGDLEAAARHFERALELDPEAAETVLQLGIAHLELGRPDAARRLLLRALELEPGSAAAHQRLGQLAADLGETRTAIGHFERALELAPGASVLHHSLGLAHRDLGNLERARYHLERQGETGVPLGDPLLDELTDLVNVAAFEEVVARIGRDDFAAAETLDFALRYLGGLEGNVEGVARYLEALRGHPEGLEPRHEARFCFLLGGLLARRTEDGRAIEHFRSAVATDPGLVEARVKLGNALARAGRSEEALRAFTDALALEPLHAAARVRRAGLHFAAGRYGEAVRDLERAAEERPGDVPTRTRLAVARLLAGDPEGFDRDRRTLAGLELAAPEAERFHLALAAGLVRAGRFEDAAGEYRSALQANGGSVDALLGLANLDGHLGRTAEALRGYREALELEPDHRPARLGEVVALLLLERRAEARSRLETALRELPPDPAFAHALARLLASAPEPALRDGARALELLASFPDLRRGLEGAETAAMAYAEAGRFEEARDLQRRVVAHLRGGAAGDRRAAAPALGEERLRAYEAGRPWRAASPGELILPSATPAASAARPRTPVEP